MRSVSNPGNFAPTRPYSPAVVADGWIHVSGHVPIDGGGQTTGKDTGEQTAHILSNIEQTLESAEADRRDIVATTVFLTDITDIDAVDSAYREFFSSGPYPTRTTVQVAALGRPAFRVEISAIARHRQIDEDK